MFAFVYKFYVIPKDFEKINLKQKQEIYQLTANISISHDNRLKSYEEFMNMLKDKELTNFLAPSFVKQKTEKNLT